jgi:hypothetical protein
VRDAHTGPLLSGTLCRRARAEPRQHDLSLGTAVKICTNTDLPRTQPGAVFPIYRDFPGILIVLIPFWSGMG